MRICAVVCEYNPFHNGHKYQLEQIKQQSGCDTVLCLMSGNFTQRGDIALFDKYTRATHAVENGADVVIELPTAFAVSSAEQFARGAIHLLASIPAVETLAFGCENGSSESFLDAARATLSEDKRFKTLLKEKMKDGTSYVKARTETVTELNPQLDETLFTKPNNILGLEYCRALLQEKSAVKPLPLFRIGGDFKDETLRKEFSSASAIRSALARKEKKEQKLLKNNLPKNVLDDCRNLLANSYPEAALCALFSATPETIALCPDCSEGLEHRLQAMTKSNQEYDVILDKCVSKRYTRARLKRIVLQNFLGVTRKLVKDSLDSPLYYKVLAVRRSRSEEILSALADGSFPVLSRGRDVRELSKDALACFALDARAVTLYNLLCRTQISEYEMKQL